jgi:hypothetical protein
MSKYFSSFPLTSYANTVCRDIIRSVGLSTAATKETALYYDFNLKDGQRADTVSYDYYDNPFYDWMVYISNDIVDPYYDWPLTNVDFDNYVKDRFGSISNALESVVYYEVNWDGDERRLTLSQYNALGFAQQKYWKPDDNNAITYVRKPLDWKVNTNRVIEIGVDTPDAFVKGDYIHQVINGTVSASGQVTFVGPTYITIHHTEGTFTNVPITATQTSASAMPTNAVVEKLVKQVIPLEEFIYWQKVTAYDREEKINISKNAIRLIDKRYVNTIQDEFESKIVNG